MSDPVYTLERLNWRTGPGDWLLLPGADPVRTFHDRTVAEAQAREREWEVRRRVNPFRVGGPFLHYQTSFDAARLFDWFLDLGLDPPEPTTDSAAWAAAWERADFDRPLRPRVPGMTDAQRAGVWEALDRVRFFRVTERAAGRALRLVALTHFEPDPVYANGGTSRYVGCTPYMLVRQPATAEGLCRQLYEDRLAGEGRYEDHRAARWRWTFAEPDPFEDFPDDPEYPYWIHEPPRHAEHRPLDLISDHDPTPGREVFVVLRRHWRRELTVPGFWRWSLTQAKSCGRPVAAFPTLAAADAHMAELEAEARRHPAPFRFGPPHEWSYSHASEIWGVLDRMAPIEFANVWNDFTAQDRLWAWWWDESVPRLTADQVADAWGLYERLKFYEVVAVEYRE